MNARTTQDKTMTASVTSALTPNKDWWRGAVIYQIYPRSYQDSNGDGIGDLKGITARLPHIAALGADAIWISPFFPSPMKDFGYDVSNYTDVDPMFGTLSDFDALIAEAHRLQIKVMIDLVISHTSDQHAWFDERRSSRDNPALKNAFTFFSTSLAGLAAITLERRSWSSSRRLPEAIGTGTRD